MTSKFALVIANTDYQDASFAKLTAPGKDAEEFAHVLREPDLAAFDDVQILLNEGESKTRRSIARFFAERKRDDLLLLYFSGHGVRNEVGQLFLAANDTEMNILDASGIPAEFVTQSMNNSRSQRQLLILDCCNSGAFAYGSKSASAVGKSMGIATAFEGSGFGRVVLTATDATQYAWEGDKVIGDTQKSVFTHFLIEGLKGEADRNSDGRIDVDELYDYAYEQVVRRTPKQTPGKWSYKQQGDIVLRENLKPRDVKPAPLPSELLEMLSHPSSSVRRAGIQDLISLLDGKHLGLARAAQEKLREIAENDDSLTLRKTANETLITRGLSSDQPAPYPIEISKEKSTEGQTTSSTEKKTELEDLLSQAIQYELKGDFWNALQIYYKIKRIDPIFPRVDIKIQELERELRPKPTQTEIKPVPQPKIDLTKFNPRLIGLIVGALFVITLSIWGGEVLLRNINRPSSTQTSIPPNPAFDIGSTMTGKDGMTLLYVPAGEFTMGSENGASDEKPVHKVILKAFWIDKTEVTNAMYAKCVQEGNCDPPNSITSQTRESYFDNTEFAGYPVVYVSWDAAAIYCSWAERRLPTEAEWEKAASWDEKNQIKHNYPWGDSIDCSFANYFGKDNGNSACVGDTAKAGVYENSQSPYGALDMAGSVWEWVADWYDANYYATFGANAANPQGPASGQYRVLRGGSWYVNDIYIHSAFRGRDNPRNADDNAGVRCALSANTQTSSALLTQGATDTSQPIATETPLPTETAIPPTPTLGIGSTIKGKDGMTLVYVPAGEFTMGSDNGESDEKPVHKVTLDAFWIDQTEVTNAMYAKCVDANQCNSPSNTNRFDDSNYANHPVIYVSWNDALAYCAWAGRRLPTEAEWEKAARGTNGNIYPWGNADPKDTLLNYNNNVGDTTAVGTYPDGKSIYGALDMAGNVWEWVSSLYQSYPYKAGDGRENLTSSDVRVLRGGSWDNNADCVRSAFRLRFNPTDSDLRSRFSLLPLTLVLNF